MSINAREPKPMGFSTPKAPFAATMGLHYWHFSTWTVSYCCSLQKNYNFKLVFCSKQWTCHTMKPWNFLWETVLKTRLKTMSAFLWDLLNYYPSGEYTRLCFNWLRQNEKRHCPINDWLDCMKSKKILSSHCKNNDIERVRPVFTFLYLPLVS